MYVHVHVTLLNSAIRPNYQQFNFDVYKCTCTVLHVLHVIHVKSYKSSERLFSQEKLRVHVHVHVCTIVHVCVLYCLYCAVWNTIEYKSCTCMCTVLSVLCSMEHY